MNGEYLLSNQIARNKSAVYKKLNKQNPLKLVLWINLYRNREWKYRGGVEFQLHVCLNFGTNVGELAD